MNTLSLIFAALILAYAVVEASRLVAKAFRQIGAGMRSHHYGDIVWAIILLLVSLGPIGHYGLSLIDSLLEMAT